MFVEVIIRVLLQRVAPEIREPYEPHQVVVVVEPPSLRRAKSARVIFEY
jgi:hypothetical protein